MSTQPYLIGVDVGGTFTDLLAYNEASGELLSAKVPSLPGEQWRGVLAALHDLGIDMDAIRAFVHGTTIATNALLERKGAHTALLTTRGFRDVLEIGKGRRLIGGLFDTEWQRPPPLVLRDRRFELTERTAADGSVLLPPALDELEALTARFKELGIESVGVAFVNAYVNAGNEAATAAALRERLPDVDVSESANLTPERGEFERTSTCVLNAYLTPVMRRYLATLADELAAGGINAGINIMGSNGGAMTLETAAGRCAATFLSGPVGGVGGSVRIASSADAPDFITFDMGGTSTDVALVKDLTPRMAYDNQIDAYPLQMPQLDIHTIGAGGGSIVWVGADGTLQIGPESAGASPGPACYGRGGTRPTISDANLLLGRLPTERPLAGGLMLDADASRNAFATIAEEIGTDDIVGLANGALSVAVAKMAGAVREVSVHRGFDPRDFVLIPFGGAGPMHGFAVAEELGMSTVLVPRYPGHLSALGQMLADQRRDFVRPWGGRLSALVLEDLDAVAHELETDGARVLESEGMGPERHQFSYTVDIRYAGQSFTLPVEWQRGSDGLDALRAHFDALHEATFGYADTDNDAEIVNVRLVAKGIVDKPDLAFAAPSGTPTPLAERPVYFERIDASSEQDTGWMDTPIFARDTMPVGFEFDGPAIVEEAGGTTIVPPGWRVGVTESGAMVCTTIAA
ncbi:MAG: hydantoinase/oxoprolinase family protein [Pseudomonadota bacterium]